MSAPSADAQQSQAALDSLRSQITQQGNTVRDLKAAKADKSQITQAVTQLNALKTQLTDAQLKHDATHASTDASSSSDEKTQLKQIRSSLEDLLLRRFFYVPSFEIYGSVGGLYDFGPSGCAVKQNLLAAWRRHFVLEEQMQEVECACMTPEVVLKSVWQHAAASHHTHTHTHTRSRALWSNLMRYYLVRVSHDSNDFNFKILIIGTKALTHTLSHSLTCTGPTG